MSLYNNAIVIKKKFSIVLLNEIYAMSNIYNKKPAIDRHIN